MKHVFVFDPRSFFDQEWKMDIVLENIGQYFRTQENVEFSIQYSKYRRNAITIIQEEFENSNPGEAIRVYAIGSGGILFDCLNAVAHFPNMQLAVIPFGVSNDFLRIFGSENLKLFRDVQAIAKAETLPTDIIRWGVNYALNSCHIGIDTALLKKKKAIKLNPNKSIFNVFSKISSSIKYFLSAFDKKSIQQKYKVTIDDEEHSDQYSLIHIANGPYFSGRITGAKDATPDDGLLDIVLIKSSGPLRTLASIRKFSRGKKPKKSIFVQAKKISIQSDQKMLIQLDNEYIEDTKINLNIIHNAVHLVVVNKLSYPIPSILAE